MIQRRLFPLRGAALLCAALATAGAARADEPAAPAAPSDAPPAPAARADEPAPPAPLPKPPAFTLPSEKSADIAAHFGLRRQYLRERDERRADDEEQRVRDLKDELAIENLFAIGGALVRESHDALAAGSSSLAIARCKLAVQMAPGMEEAHLCLARAILADNPAALQPAFAELYAAAETALRDPRLSRAALANVLGVLFLGLVAASAAFVLLLFARYARLYAHDMHHVLPPGGRRWQTKLLAFVLVLLPLLLGLGPLPLLFTALVAVALYLTALEAVLAVAVLAAVVAAPLAAENIGRVASFAGPATDVWLLEHGEGSPPEIARLQKRVAAEPNDFAVAFALARKAKRDGDLATAGKLYERAIAAGSTAAGLAAAHNDLGNVLLLQGDPHAAQAQYRKAIELRETMAAPHFNLSRALGVGGVEALEKVQAEQARATELDRAGIREFAGPQLEANRKSNKFVLDVPLDDELLGPLAESEERAAVAVADEVRARLAVGLPHDAAAALPIGAALLVLVLFGSRGKLKPSGRCGRCGREVCRRCDPDARPGEQLCAQCVNVFVRRTGVEPAERLRKERAAESYRRRRLLLARFLNLFSGAGHVLAGHPLRGIAYLTLTSSLVVSVLIWHGLAHGPVAVRSGVSLFRVGLTAAAFIAIYALCLRDLVRRQRAPESS